MALVSGRKAPEFTLPDANGDKHKLSSYKGQWVLIYFYPKDDTPGCTKQACAIRDHHRDPCKIRLSKLRLASRERTPEDTDHTCSLEQREVHRQQWNIACGESENKVTALPCDRSKR